MITYGGCSVIRRTCSSCFPSMSFRAQERQPGCSSRVCDGSMKGSQQAGDCDEHCAWPPQRFNKLSSLGAGAFA